MALTEAALTAEALIMEASQEALKEVALKEVEENFFRMEFTDIFESKEFSSNLAETIKEKEYLNNTFENLPENPTEAMIRLEEMKSPRIKGDLGETILESTDKMFGNVEKQIRVDSNRVDMLTEYNKTAKFQKMVVENGQL